MKQREIKNWFENFKPRNILTQHIKYLEYVKRKSWHVRKKPQNNKLPVAWPKKYS